MTLPIDEQITFLYCEDIEKVAPFYEDVLGFELALNQGGCRIYHIVGRKSYVGICERATPRSKDGVIFTIVTQAVDAWYERITSYGVTCEHPPQTNETYGIYHFFVKDPTGYLIEVQRFLDVNWDQSK
jgi:catechol 2,3-dioxygenase-like lactoylglutathione lyase family enzyme